MTSHRTTVLREATDAIRQHVHCQTHTEANAKQNAIDLLTRMADEAQPTTSNPSVITDRVLSQVLAERVAQDAKWGEQNHADGTGAEHYVAMADEAREDVELFVAQHSGPEWALVLLEEVYEALAEHDPAKLRAELLQVAAVAVAWAEAIDRRTA